jgi:hypothetical protein
VQVNSATPQTNESTATVPYLQAQGAGDLNVIATDSTGSLYFISGDGTMNANTGGTEYGDSYIRLSPSGTVQDYFSPGDQASLNNLNLDPGSGGVLLLPDQGGAHPHEMLSAGKDGSIYLVDRDNMGHFNASTDQIVQELVGIFPNNLGIEGGNFGSPVYWNGRVYFAPVGGPVQAFSLTNGLLSTSPTSQSSETYNGRGGTMSISANGSSNGILWTLQTAGACAPGILHAYDATNLSNELYNSNQAGTRDQLDEWDKFTVPVVGDGEVFVTSTSQTDHLRPTAQQRELTESADSCAKETLLCHGVIRDYRLSL